MAETKDDEGWMPAFPTDNEQQAGAETYHFQGISIRMYIAAKAMQAKVTLDGWFSRNLAEDAKECLLIADTMIAAGASKLDESDLAAVSAARERAEKAREFAENECDRLQSIASRLAAAATLDGIENRRH